MIKTFVAQIDVAVSADLSSLGSLESELLDAVALATSRFNRVSLDDVDPVLEGAGGLYSLGEIALVDRLL